MRAFTAALLVLVSLVLLTLAGIACFAPFLCGRALASERREIPPDELIAVLNRQTIVEVSTTHAQDIWLTTRWGFRYHCVWDRRRRPEIPAGIDASDALNLISGYDRLKRWNTMIACE